MGAQYILVIMLITANAAGANELACLPKHGGARDNKFLVTYPMTELCVPTLLNFRDRTPSALTYRGYRAPQHIIL
jgi:hypothetical protein